MTIKTICSRACAWLTAALLGAAAVAESAAADSAAIRYNRDIRPLLSDNCFACHGPDSSKRKGKLRLDVREEAVAKKAIVPGKADESELVRRILTADEDEVMPPRKSQKKLTADQKDLLSRWIAKGAEYQAHWAYIAPAKSETSAGKSPIDTLVQRRLDRIGLQPAPEADRRTLARRLSFDLVGLPPRPEEVDAFEHDPLPDAYDKLVESLLRSPHYGERMAIGWLDVVRFADTIGYHSDNPRNIWPYRDYVIKSFNENKPFDRFTREQLAGDLLPGSTMEDKVGSAFNRLLLSTEEGGAQPKDYEARMLTDRARAVGAVWLGQTVGCAQCHDHKFDPITSRDFYSLGAFFADIQEPIIGAREPGMLVPNPSQAARLEVLEQAIARVRQRFELPRPKALSEWETSTREAIAAEPGWIPLMVEEAVAEGGPKLKVDADGSIVADGASSKGSVVYRVKVRSAALAIAGLRLEALASDALPAHGPGRGADGGFSVTELQVLDASGNSIPVAQALASFQTTDGPALEAVDGSLAPGNGWTVRGMGGAPQALVLSLAQPMDGDDTLTVVLTQAANNAAVLGRFKLAATADPALLHAPITPVPPREIAEIVATDRSARSQQQTTRLVEYYRSIAPELSIVRQELAAAQKVRDEFEAGVPRCLVSTSMEKPRTVRVLPRGNWILETGDIVQPALPSYLAPAKSRASERPLTRLDLANWLVGRENPLTARVVVNRLWKQFFGMGLSKVLDDFGSQGEVPPDQELLDWLACEFMESGWDVKHMIRLMVTSRTYKQVSTASPDLQTRDPYNRELARQSRWRLEAELVRDNALSMSGLLVDRVGGPSVKPYQPEGYWENLNFPVRTYEPSQGDDQYRRGIYTWWQRSYVHPSFLAFDAPTREECAAERSRSNIPQQALALLNDPSYVEAARVFAARILQEGGKGPEDRIAWAWRQVLCRAPRPDEVHTAQALLEKHWAEYKRDRDAAQALLKVGLKPAPAGLDPAELAAWSSVARVLLNLHETITRS